MKEGGLEVRARRGNVTIEAEEAEVRVMRLLGGGHDPKNVVNPRSWRKSRKWIPPESIQGNLVLQTLDFSPEEPTLSYKACDLLQQQIESNMPSASTCAECFAYILA